MKNCEACGHFLALAPVKEGDQSAGLCLECMTAYQNDRPDGNEPMNDFLDEFLESGGAVDPGSAN